MEGNITAQSSRRLAWRPYLLAMLVGVVGLALSIIAALGLHREAVRHDWERFGELAHRMRAALDTRVEKYQLALEGLRDFVSRDPEMTQGEWRLRVETLNPPTCYSAFLRLEHWRGEPTNAWPVETDPPLPIERWATNSPVISAIHRSGFDFQRNLFWRVAGLAAPSNSIIPVDIARASIRSGEPRITPAQVITVNGRGRTRTGTLLILPVLGQDLAAAAASPRFKARKVAARSRLQEGVVFGAIDWNQLLRDTGEARFGDVVCEIFAAPEPDESHRVIHSPFSPTTNSVSGIPKPGLTRDRSALQTNLTWLMFHEKWCLAFTTTQKFAAESTRYRAWLALGSGSAVTLLMGGLLAVQIRARLRDAAQSTALLEAQKERMEISRDLHDGAIQSLYAVQLALGRLQDRLRQLPPRDAHLLGESRHQIDEVIAELRRFLIADPDAIRPDAPADLSEVLHALIDRLQATTDTRLVVELDETAAREVSAALALQIAALVAEALSNAVRHARASEVRLRFSPASVGGWRLEISDDGIGFDPANLPRRSGLKHLHGRAVELGGQLTIDTAPGRGTHICAILPASQ